MRWSNGKESERRGSYMDCSNLEMDPQWDNYDSPPHPPCSHPLSPLLKPLLLTLHPAITSPSHPQVQFLLSLCLSILSLLQGLTLILSETDPVTDQEVLQLTLKILNYSRIDVQAVAIGAEIEYFYGTMWAIYGPVVGIMWNFALVWGWKKRPNGLVIKLSCFSLALIEEALFIPILVFLLSQIKYTYLSSAESMDEYAAAADRFRSVPCSVLALLSIPVLFAALYINAQLVYCNRFHERHRRFPCYRDSLTRRCTLTLTVAMVFLSFSIVEVSRKESLISFAIVSYMLVHIGLSQMSSYTPAFTAMLVAKGGVLIWAVVCCFVGIACNSGKTTVFLVAFVSPGIAVVTAWAVCIKTSNFRKIAVKSIKTPHDFELKLRSLLGIIEKKQGNMEKTHRSIEEMMEFGGRCFGESGWMALWEAGYYYGYRNNAATALLKLAKAGGVSLTFELSFFLEQARYIYEKSDKSPERLYLRSLTLLRKAKAADERSCFLLVSLCSELLAKEPSFGQKKFIEKLRLFSKEIKETTRLYMKQLAGNSEDAEAMELLGSFLMDVRKEQEGGRFVVRARMARDKAENGKGVVVVTGEAGNTGNIVLATPAALCQLHSTLQDLLHKSISCFLPPPYRSLFPLSLSFFLENCCNFRPLSELCSLLTDSLGFLLPIAVSTKVTTYKNRPYFILTLTPIKDSIIILVSDSYTIEAHTEITGKEGVSWVGADLDCMFPGLRDRVECDRAQSGEFQYGYGGKVSLAVTVDTAQVALSTFRVVYLKKVNAKTEVEGCALVREDCNPIQRDVHFPCESQTLLPDGRFSRQSQLSTSNLLAETEAKLTKKLDISLSLATSTATSTGFEQRETVKMTRSVRKVKLFLLLAVGMLAAGAITSVVFIRSILDSLKGIQTVREYGRRNLGIISLAYDVRSIMLSDSPSFPYDVSTLALNVQQISGQLTLQTTYMKNLVGTGSTQVDAYLTHNLVPLWLKLDSSFLFYTDSMLDAMLDVTLCANTLVAGLPPFAQRSEAFYVYRNGAGELFQVANRTLFTRVKEDKQDRSDRLSIIGYLLIACGVLAVVPLLSLVGPQFWALEREHHRLWTKLMNVPKEQLGETRAVCVERIQGCFGSEVFIDLAPSHCFHRPISPPLLWPTFSLRISIYLLAVLSFLLCLELAYISPIRILAATIPNYLFWSGMRGGLVLEGLFWAREGLISQSDVSYSSLIPEGELWSDPWERVVNTTSSISFITKILNFGDWQHGVEAVKKSDHYLDYIYTNACEDLGMSQCAGSDSSLGQAYTIKDWVQTILAVYNNNSSSFEEIDRVERLMQEAVAAAEFAAEMYMEGAEADIDACSRETAGVIVALMGVIGVMYVGVLAKALNDILAGAKEVLEIDKILRVKLV